VQTNGYLYFINHYYIFEGRDSAVGIVTGYALYDLGVGVLSPGRVNNFLHVVQTGSGIHTASYSMVTGVEADHSPPANAKAKEM
jgi:hypothetical protein